MRLHELFEAPFTQPGTTFIVNDPQDPQMQPAINPGRSIGTATAPPTTITTPASPAKSTQVPASAIPTINSAQTGSNTANAAALSAASQQLTKGSPITLPLGPNKQPTPMKVTNTDNNQKTVTIANQQTPNAPQQTYKADDLQKMIANKENQ